MIRTLNFLLLGTCVAALIGVYALKFSVEETAAKKVAVERRIDQQNGQLSLLKADWAYLNQPAHVAPIVARHEEALGLAPVKPEQFGSLASLPMRPAAPDAAALNDLFQSLNAGVDPDTESIGDQ
jgi:hypothetical protein